MAKNRTKTVVHGLKSLNMGVHVHCTQILEVFSMNMYICTSVKMVIYVKGHQGNPDHRMEITL